MKDLLKLSYSLMKSSKEYKEKAISNKDSLISSIYKIRAENLKVLSNKIRAIYFT